MRIEVCDTVLTPEPLITDDVEGSTENPRVYRVFKVAGICLRPFEQTTVGKAGVKARFFETRAHNVFLPDVLFIGPDRATDGMGKRTQIPATGILCRDESIGRWCAVCRPMRRVQVEFQTQLFRLPGQFLCAVFDPAGMAFLWRGAAGAPKTGNDVKRLVIYAGAMFFSDRFEPLPGQVAIGRECRKIIVDLGHSDLPWGMVALRHRSPVLSEVQRHESVISRCHGASLMRQTSEPKLISGNANMPLAKAIARRMSLHRGVNVGLVDTRVERFNDGEIFVEVFENVRGEDMFIIQSTSNPANDNLMELLIMADALRRSSAARVTAVLPYFGYARQDRRTKARTPITAKMVANMLVGTGVERVLTMDLHAAQIQGFFDIPVDNLYASPVFALDIKNTFKDRMGELMVVSPDVGGVGRARELAKRINSPLSIVDKRREKPGEIAEMTIIGDVTDKICLIVDDICDTAGTLCKAAQVLMENGAKEVHSYISHGVMSGPAVERVTNSVMKSLVITDTIAPSDEIKQADNIRIVPTAPIFAQAILNIWNGTSVSSLFEAETLGPIYDGMYSAD